MRRISYVCSLALLVTNLLFSQQITIDNTVPLQQLVENNLVEGCFEITNISSPVNGSVNGFFSYAYFERASSNFPFENGIMLSTGNANSGGNTVNTNILNEGQSNWGTDPDLEATLGISNTLNATSIEFDFVSISNTVQFNYLLASEEYFSNFPCDYSDGFAFLIKPSSSTGPYQNIALVPGTSIPVNTNTVHDEIVGFCPEQNGQYFDGYNMGDTNYNGRTQVLTASASITPYQQYHIKLIIADQTDQNYDSAVFIQGNSFNSVVDLGNDITTCADMLTLDADIQNSQATYTWLLNGNPIPGENNPTLNVTQSGTYSVQVGVQLNSSSCVIEDSININLSSQQTGTPLADYELCDDASGDGVETFDLSTKDAEVLASVPAANYAYSYHYSSAEALNNVNSITNPIQNTSNPQTIFVRIEDVDSGCLAYSTFNLVVNSLPNISAPAPLEMCDSGVPDGFTQFDLTEKDLEITNGQSNLTVSYHYTQADANTGNNPIFSPYTNVTADSEQLFVRIVNTNTGCFVTTTLPILVIANPIINRDSHYIDACDPDHDGFATFDLTTIIPEILEGLTGVTTSFYTTYEDAEDGVNPITNETSFDNTDFEQQTLFIRVVDDVTGCVSITSFEIHPNLLLTGTVIRDFSFCDNQDNDGTINVSLGNLADTIDADIPDLVITFYESQTDLDNGVNALDPLVPYEVTNNATLYITIENSTCSEEAFFEINVNTVNTFGPITPIDYCDTDDDGFTTIDLGSLESAVTSGDSNYTVQYFNTQQDAQNGTNALPLFYNNVSNPETIYVRIISTGTSCYTTDSFELNVIPAPTTSTPSNELICDMDSNGSYTINLNDKIAELVSDTTDLSITFFQSVADADNNTNAISNPSAFSTGSTLIVARIESQITGCYALESFQITVNTLPVIPSISNFRLCEDDNDSVTDFYLVDKDSEILNGQTNKEVLYFETLADAENNQNPIDKTNAYQNTSSPQTLYIRVHNLNDFSCYATGSFTIEVAPNPIFNEPTDWIICDDVSNDGINVFDLNEKLSEITQGSPDNLNITFHASQQNAQDNVNPLPMQYTNTQNPQQIYVRIQNETYCTIIRSFGINIIPSPEVSESEPLEICDDTMDGIATFNLTDSLFDILDVRQDNIAIGYYETMDDLEAQTSEITTPENYNNTSNPQTVYIRVTNTITQCYQAIPLDLIVNFPPTVNTLGAVEACYTEDQTYNLSQVNGLVVNDTSGLSITYYTSQNDAETNQNAIVGDFNYTANNTTLYVRVENTSTGCYTVTSFTLQINPLPLVGNAPDLEDCDDDDDAILEFDLSENQATLLAGQNPNNFTVSYYNTETDAQADTNALNTNYTAFDGETIFVRIENNTTGCFSTGSFGIIVHDLPIIDLQDTIALCLDDLPLTINASTNQAGDTYLWSTGETSAAIDVYPNALGDYWVTVTTPYGCEATKNFTVIESEIATINFTTTVDFADPNSITVDISGSGDYEFSLDHGPWQTSNVFDTVTLGLHTVTVRDVNGCSDVSQEVVVIDTPKFMTPNNDGYFDTWHIVGVESLPGTVVYIYDRYGKLLKTLAYNSPGWDGTYNGANMPSDDYWFLAEVQKDGIAFNVKGHFALKR